MEFTISFLGVFLDDVLNASPILGFLLLLILLVGYLIGRLEGWTAFDAVYHAFINATTVGYGDFRPSRKGSKVLTVLLAFVGLIFTGVIVAIAVHAAIFAFGDAQDVAGLGQRAWR
jgi:voltage-gated potassium channel